MTQQFVMRNAEKLAEAMAGIEEFFISENTYEEFSQSVMDGLFEVSCLALWTIENEDTLDYHPCDTKKLIDFLFHVKSLTQHLKAMGALFESKNDEQRKTA